MQKINTDHQGQHVGKDSSPLRHALNKDFSEEFMNFVMKNPKINGVVVEGASLSSEMKSQIMSIHLHGEEVRSKIVQSLLKIPELRGKKGDELKKAAKILRDKFNEVITPLMH